MGVLTEPKAWRRERPKTETRRSSDLTPAEQENVRKALLFLKVKLGGWAKLAAAMRGSETTVRTAACGRPLTAGIALRAARLGGVPLERVLSGAWPEEGACPHCGRGPST